MMKIFTGNIQPADKLLRSWGRLDLLNLPRTSTDEPFQQWSWFIIIMMFHVLIIMMLSFYIVVIHMMLLGQMMRRPGNQSGQESRREDGIGPWTSRQGSLMWNNNYGHVEFDHFDDYHDNADDHLPLADRQSWAPWSWWTWRSISTLPFAFPWWGTSLWKLLFFFPIQSLSQFD